jgi:cell filamentation protein
LSNFGLAQPIEDALSEWLSALAKECFLAGLTPVLFCERAAYSPGEIKAIPPFREGNGRTQRECIRQLALSAGHASDRYGFSQQQMVDASVASHLRADDSGLAHIVRLAMGQKEDPS